MTHQKRKWLFIEPHDVLMFRDSRPFAAGINFVARSIFPPTPMTMQGILRGHAIEQARNAGWHNWQETLKEKIGTAFHTGGKTTLGSLRIQGPFAARWRSGTLERLVPVPNDVLYGKDTSPHYRVLEPAHNSDFDTNLPFVGWQPLHLPNVKVGEEYEKAGGWMIESGFKDYLLGKPLKPEHFVRTAELYEYDERIGLALNYDSRTARNEMLYHAEFVRLCPEVGLLVEVNADLFDDSEGVINTGGESRSSYFRTVDYTPPHPATTSGNLKIVLLTPAYFSDGWQPQAGWSNWVGSGKLVSMSLGKPQYISGWDAENGQRKPMYHYVPAGSVYYFEKATLQNENFTESPPHMEDAGAAGFGCFAVGTW